MSALPKLRALGDEMKIWECKIGEAAGVPGGSDLPMRVAVKNAYREITGRDCEFCFSGWGAKLTEPERACVENRLPTPEPSLAEEIIRLRAELDRTRRQRDKAITHLEEAVACLKHVRELAEEAK